MRITEQGFLRAEALVKLRMRNEEKQKKAEQMRLEKLMEEESQKERLLKSLEKKDYKVGLYLDMAKMEQQRKHEAGKRKLEEDLRLRQEEESIRELEKQNWFVAKLQQETHRLQKVEERRKSTIQMKRDMERQRIKEQTVKLLNVNIDHQQQ